MRHTYLSIFLCLFVSFAVPFWLSIGDIARFSSVSFLFVLVLGGRGSVILVGFACSSPPCFPCS